MLLWREDETTGTAKHTVYWYRLCRYFIGKGKHVYIASHTVINIL